MITLVRKYDDKDVYFGSGTLSQINSDISVLKPHFVCAIFLDQYDWRERELKSLLRNLIECGAAYLLFHGDRCELAHDLADDAQTSMFGEIVEENVIGTTWHDEESEEEVFFTAFQCSFPADDYLQKFSAYVVIAVGNQAQADRIRRLLDNLETTIEVGGARIRARE